MNIKSYKVIDLFCGCGGLSLGFQQADFNIVAAFDYWDAALNIYQKISIILFTRETLVI